MSISEDTGIQYRPPLLHCFDGRLTLILSSTSRLVVLERLSVAIFFSLFCSSKLPFFIPVFLSD